VARRFGGRACLRLRLLVGRTALGPTAMRMFVPALPAIRDAFGTDTATVQLAFSLSTLAVAFTTLLVGALSDRFGRQPVAVGGLAIYLLGTLLSLVASSIGWLVLGRIVQAAGAPGCASTRAIVRDLWGCNESAQMITWLTMAMPMAPIMAPAMGGIMTELYA
jgi:DHA1 family bicyclomycin/chloramphenicol resistance-like MFS transporter